MTDGRDETPAERSDRNWKDLVQELRVLQTGTQILAAFLLTIAFQPRFEDLDGFGVSLYLVVLSAAAVAMAFGIAPVMLHRALFRRQMKRVTVEVGDVLLRIAYAFVCITIVGTVMLVFDFVLGRTEGIVAGAVSAAIVLVLSVAVPVAVRRGREPDA